MKQDELIGKEAAEGNFILVIWVHSATGKPKSSILISVIENEIKEHHRLLSFLYGTCTKMRETQVLKKT